MYTHANAHFHTAHGACFALYYLSPYFSFSTTSSKYFKNSRTHTALPSAAAAVSPRYTGAHTLVQSMAATEFAALSVRSSLTETNERFSLHATHTCTRFHTNTHQANTLLLGTHTCNAHTAASYAFGVFFCVSNLWRSTEDYEYSGTPVNVAVRWRWRSVRLSSRVHFPHVFRRRRALETR